MMMMVVVDDVDGELNDVPDSDDDDELPTLVGSWSLALSSGGCMRSREIKYLRNHASVRWWRGPGQGKASHPLSYKK